MVMQVTDFCQLLSNPDQKAKSRVIMVQKSIDFLSVMNQYDDETFEQVEISRFIDANLYVPMPARVFSLFDKYRKELKQQGRIPILLGLDGYLAILSPDNIRKCFIAIKHYLDSVGIDSVIIVLRRKWNELWEEINNPRWHQGMNVIEISGTCVADIDERIITFVDLRLIERLGGGDNLKTYLAKVERESISIEDPVNIFVVFNGQNKFPGLSPNIKQIEKIREGFEIFCNFNADLTDDAFDWVVENTKTINVYDELHRYFLPFGVSEIYTNSLKQFYEFAKPAEQEVFLFLLKCHAKKDSYLGTILKRVTPHFDTFDFFYINPPLDIILSPQAQEWAQERANAIRKCGNIQTDFAFDEFIKALASIDDINKIIPWLNLKTELELTELCRRALQDVGGELDVIKSNCSLIEDYLSEVSCGDVFIDDYMAQYRKQKILGIVTKEFADLAYHSSIPHTINSRSNVLNEYKNDSSTCVIVIDALGIEWLPFIVQLANKQRLVVASASCAYTNLPTVTKFNNIKNEWGEEHYLKVDDFDEILHTSFPKPEMGFAKELLYIRNNVIKYVQYQLEKYERVILTADHGASRLAMLAYSQNLSKTLSINTNIEIKDWRYALKPPAVKVSSSDFDVDCNDNFAIVKGYNRLPQPGGPKFEAHGGATLEERIVPIVVFKKGNFVEQFVQRVQQKQPVVSNDISFKSDVQIVENNAFDDL